MIVEGLTFCEAVKEMKTGSIVQYVGTVNGHIASMNGSRFLMKRGVLFGINEKTKNLMMGGMVYDEDFRYKVVGKQEEKRWVNVVEESVCEIYDEDEKDIYGD